MYNKTMYTIVNSPDRPEFLNPSTDPRNVVDEFKGMATDIIRMQMQTRRVEAVNVAMNLTNDFNKASCLRANEAFAFKEFVFVNKPNPSKPKSLEGVKHWDKRGGVGMEKYANVRHVIDWKALFAEYKEAGYTIYAVDNTAGYNPKVIYNVTMPAKSVFVYGEENLGLSKEMIEACDELIYIPQFGVPRSLNISQAAAICMAEYSRQHQPVLD